MVKGAVCKTVITGSIPVGSSNSSQSDALTIQPTRIIRKNRVQIAATVPNLLRECESLPSSVLYIGSAKATIACTDETCGDSIEAFDLNRPDASGPR